MFDFGSFSSLGVTSTTLALDSKTRTPPGHLRCFRRRQQTALSASAVDVHVWSFDICIRSLCPLWLYERMSFIQDSVQRSCMKEWVLFKILCRGAEAFLTCISAIIMYTLILQRCWKTLRALIFIKAEACSKISKMFHGSMLFFSMQDVRVQHYLIPGVCNPIFSVMMAKTKKTHWPRVPKMTKLWVFLYYIYILWIFFALL